MAPMERREAARLWVNEAEAQQNGGRYDFTQHEYEQQKYNNNAQQGMNNMRARTCAIIGETFSIYIGEIITFTYLEITSFCFKFDLNLRQQDHTRRW